MRVYLDACCLSRLTDDQSQPRIRAEAEAIEGVIRMVRKGMAFWIASTVLALEASRNPDPNRRLEAEALLSFADDTVTPTVTEALRGRELEKDGFSAFDALHLASAEQGKADIFLTTDDALLRRSRRNLTLKIRVENPVSWYQEVRYDLHRTDD